MIDTSRLDLIRSNDLCIHVLKFRNCTAVACTLKHFRYVGLPDHHEGLIDTSRLDLFRSMQLCANISQLYGCITVKKLRTERSKLRILAC
jgi:hypothetical protein